MAKKKKITIDDLAIMVKVGFDEIGERFDEIGERFNKIDKRFDKIDDKLKEHDLELEKINLKFSNVAWDIDVREHKRRIEILEKNALKSKRKG
jgi:hypothetical protein